MKNLLDGTSPVYETTYRIKASDGQYIMFYDYGQISQKTDKTTTVIGFVKKIASLTENSNEIQSFKELLTKGDISIVDLFTKLHENKKQL